MRELKYHQATCPPLFLAVLLICSISSALGAPTDLLDSIPTNLAQTDSRRSVLRALAASTASKHKEQSRLPSQLSRFGVESHAGHIRGPQIVHETGKLLLLTNGEQIKLYPLNGTDLTPSGGYYVLRSREQFNLSDPTVIKTLNPNSTFTRWLQYKRQVAELRSNGNITTADTSSILPQESRRRNNTGGLVDESELFTSDNLTAWKRPLISDVGYLFDNRFCDSHSSALVHNNNCLVIFWLDKRNKYLRFGSVLFTYKNRVQLLSSKFSANGNLRSLSDENKKTIWIHEFPPVDLCRQAAKLDDQMANCEVFDMAINRFDRSFHVALGARVADQQQLAPEPCPTRIMSGQIKRDPSLLEHNSKQQFQDMLQFDEFSLDRTCEQSKFNMKNLVNIAGKQTHLFYLDRQDGGGKIKSLELGKHLEYDVEASSLPVAGPELVNDISSEFKNRTSQTEGLGMINKEIPSAIAMTANNFKCQLYWLNTNNELYSSDLAGQHVQLVERLSSKPAIRLLDVMLSYRDILFFSDLATKSIMSYNITKRMQVNRQDKPSVVRPMGKKKFELVPRLETTHQVLLVETSAIRSFSLIDLDENLWELEGMCRPDQLKKHDEPNKTLLGSMTGWLDTTVKLDDETSALEPRVIDDDLTDHITMHKLGSNYKQHELDDIMHMSLIILLTLLMVFVLFMVSERIYLKKLQTKSLVKFDVRDSASSAYSV